MKFRKRMRPVIKTIRGRVYEAVDWFHSKSHAEKKAKQYRNQGFFADVVFEKDWIGWFVYIHRS